MNADHIFFATIEDVAEIIGQFFEKTLVERFVRPDRQAFQFLNVPALCAQAALSNGFGGSDQIIAMNPVVIPAHDIAG